MMVGSPGTVRIKNATQSWISLQSRQHTACRQLRTQIGSNRGSEKELKEKELKNLTVTLESIVVKKEDFEAIKIEEAFNKLETIIKDNINNIIGIDTSEHNKESSIIPGKRRFKATTKATPQWNDKCAEAIRNRKIAFREWRIHLSKENLDTYRNANTVRKNTIKREKRKSWHQFCTEIDRNIPISKMWKFTKMYRRNRANGN